MEYSEDHIALAAEYALGTLDADERAQVETMMATDSEFAAIVHAWEFRLGVLNQMVGSVEPPPELWERIRTAVGLTGQQAPLLLPETPPPIAPMVLQDLEPGAPPPPVVDTSNVVQLSGRVRAYRNIAAAMTAIAAALLALIGVQVVSPGLLPGLGGKPPVQVVEVKPTPRRADAHAGSVSAICRAAAGRGRRSRLHPHRRRRDAEFHRAQGRRAAN